MSAAAHTPKQGGGRKVQQRRKCALNKATAQRDLLLEHLRSRGAITIPQAHALLGIDRISEKIEALRNEGFRIATTWVTDQSDPRRPNHIARYTLLAPDAEMRSWCVPAEPGYFVLSVKVFELRTFWRLPVIAWILDEESDAPQPIMPRGPASAIGDWDLQTPEGVVHPDGLGLINLDEWMSLRFGGRV